MQKIQYLIKGIKSYQLSFVIFCLIFLVAQRQFAFLKRFPNQDLLWNDLQLRNEWRWLRETITNSGYTSALTGSIDFRQNFGENLYANSKSTNFVYDPGAWVYAITGNLDFSIFVKLFIFSVLCFLGILRLVNKFGIKNKYQINYIPFLSLFIFYSFISHPNLYHEVGFLNLWVVLLTPYLIHLFISHEMGNLSRFIKIILITLLATGSTDIHVFSHLTIIAIFTFLLCYIYDLNMKLAVKLFTIVFFVTLVQYIPYLSYLGSNFYVSKLGAFEPAYFDKFFIQLLLKGFVLPAFSGPISIYLNIGILLIIGAFSLNYPAHSNDWRVIFWFLVFLFVLLISISSILHSINFISDRLPSLIRYPFAIFPFLAIISLIFLPWHEINRKNYIILFSLIIILIPVQNILNSKVVPPFFREIRSETFRDYLLVQTPTCINEHLSGQGIRENERSIVFITEPFSVLEPIGRNDIQTFQIETPDLMHARTFFQWKYSTSTLNAQFNESLLGSQTTVWSPVEKDFELLMKYMDDYNFNILLASSKLSNPPKHLVFLGSCEYSKVYDSVTERNTTLRSNTFVYFNSNVKNHEIVSSNKITYRNSLVGGESTLLNVSFSNDVRAKNSEGALKIYNKDNRVEIIPMFNSDGNFYIYSFSIVLIVKYLLTLFLLILVILVNFRKKFLY